jgi:hypothetical protein
MGVGKDFLDETSKTGDSSKTRQMGLHQDKKFLYNSGNDQQAKKTAYRTGGVIFQPHISIQNILIAKQIHFKNGH